MRIILSDSKEEAVLKVAERVVEKIQSRPASVIGLATGRTMEPLYAAWAKLAQDQKLDQSKCFFFMLDEYIGIGPEHPSSFTTYIKERLLIPNQLREDQFAFPPASALELEAAARAYEQNIKEAQGIDLQLLGIGTNGHIGFNEPGSEVTSRTRRVQLTRETILANGQDFQGTMPTEALSMGIGTILECKELLMLVTGSSKAPVIKYLLNHHDDPNCPATFLKRHPNFTLVLDPAAASKINLKI